MAKDGEGKELSSKEKSQFKKSYKSDSFLISYMKVLGFTLAKVELGVWKLYLEESKLTKNDKKHFFKLFIIFSARG